MVAQVCVGSEWPDAVWVRGGSVYTWSPKVQVHLFVSLLSFSRLERLPVWHGGRGVVLYDTVHDQRTPILFRLIKQY